MDVLTKTFEGHEIRALGKDGEVLVVGADLAKALGYKQAHGMYRIVDDRYKGRTLVHTPGGKQKMTVLREPGVFQVLGTTTKPAARDFQDWLWEELLPDLRRGHTRLPQGGLAERADALRSEIDALRSEIQDKQAGIDARQAKLDEAKAALSEIVGGGNGTMRSRLLSNVREESNRLWGLLVDQKMSISGSHLFIECNQRFSHSALEKHRDLILECAHSSGIDVDSVSIDLFGAPAMQKSDEPPQLNESGLPTEMASRESEADLTDPAVTNVIDAARHLVLERPLVLYDLETTGIKTETARIVQVAMYRMVPGDDGAPVACPDAPTLLTYLDPEQPIPEAASDVNGITTADVSGMPTFAAVAEGIAEMIQDADLSAYNGASFDIPLLRNEFVRTGYPGLPGPDDRKIVDPYLIERRLMPRSLEAAHRRYTGERLKDAHDADADIRGTWRVLEEQVKRIPDAGDAVTPADLDDFARGDYLDMGRKLKRDGDDVIVMFGKHSGSSLRWLRENEPGYLQWMIGEIGDLRPYIKDHLSDA